ncbi:dynein associated protein-domain-containing protein [Fomitopsis serialis]|uniref:dynein associated protein-domain-containing protein n=1 Tax=Fomitopsis serialis TaxID=139415 RepID=UPI002008697F|nr:dynein associated protein-domain-containing protein [Neoantrodia serialis]KAH9926495.1 dynein associated protein-domain-containing protein [Neoantrodia serialis]
MAATAKDPPLGAQVEVPSGRGIVRFCGTTSFSQGKWIGIELFERNGKNDGIIQGIKYFTCKPNYGVFVRPSQVKVVAVEPPPVAAPIAARPGLGHARTGSTGSARARLTPASPGRTAPSSPGPQRLGSPTKRTSTLSLNSRAPLSRRSSINPGASPTLHRQGSFESAAGDAPAKLFPKGLAPSPMSVSGHSVQPPSSLRRVSGDSPEPLSPVVIQEPERPSTPVKPSAPPPPDDESQELRAKIRVLEAKRADDARHVRELETRLAEAESFVALRPKLQAKLQQQQTELIATRRELADSQQLASLADNRIVDAQEQLEMAMLDKEMAEERAELAEAELEEVKEKLAVVEVELQVVREGGGEGEGNGGENNIKQSLAYVQLERQNERLKEALVRLRDITSESEIENRKRIAEMEKDVGTLDELQAQHEEALYKLTNAEVQRNLMLGEKIEEMRITIEDLEALRELNDELEENHVETEKSMQERSAKETLIREQAAKIASLEEACQDLEGTIVRFRELVMQLQTNAKCPQESVTAASQTAAMMSLNLNCSPAPPRIRPPHRPRDQAHRAKEAHELLSIIQPYLPQVYVESDTDATSCYLFFQRLALKLDLINTVAAQNHNLPESLNGAVSSVLVVSMRGRLSSLSTICKRFASVLRRCDKRIDMHIDLLRREEFRDVECVNDAAKMQAQFDHLAETYFNGYEFDLGEREHGMALACDHDFEFAAILKDEDVEVDLGELEPNAVFFEPLQRLLDQSRSARKLTKRLEDLTQDSSALKAQFVSQLQGLANLTPELVNFGFSLAQLVMPYLGEVRGDKTPFKLSSVLAFVQQTARASVGQGRKDDVSSWESVADFITQVSQEANKLLPAAVENENVLKISGTSPWVVRVADIKAATAINVEAERKVAQLNDELQALARTLRTRDQQIQESDALEQDNAKLKAAVTTTESKPTGPQPAEQETVAVEGSLETSYLLEQIDALRGTVRYFRTENSYLKGQDLLREIESLPPLREPVSREPTPPLVPSTLSDSEDSDSDEPPPPTLRTLTAESKLLYREVINYTSSPRVVDLSVMRAKREGEKASKHWMPKEKTPAYQVMKRKMEGERLGRRLQGLLERTSAYAVR